MSDPSGAELRRDGTLLGVTPLRIARVPPEERTGYTLHKVGYRDVSVELTPGDDCHIDIALQQQGPQ